MIANIASDDALILPLRANPAGLDFRERQATANGVASDNSADFGGSQFVRVEHVHVNEASLGMQRRRRRKTPLCLGRSSPVGEALRMAFGSGLL